MKKRSITRVFLVLLLFLISSGLILYPFLANYLFENRADSLVQTVEKTAEEIDDSERFNQLELAQEYNEMISSGHVKLQDPFEAEEISESVGQYDALLCLNEDGVMGFIKIPKIGVSLPVYHGTSEQTLEIGAGHLEGTSLPIGGKSSHSVITGHTGLSKAKLFTDLSELEERDLFFLHIYGEKLAYQIDQIKTVLPYELDELAIVPDEDYCTLVTCTPYGVNTHRLLVRGKRTSYQNEQEQSESFKAKRTESKWMQEYKRDIILSFSLLAIGVFLLVVNRYYWQKHRNREREA